MDKWEKYYTSKKKPQQNNKKNMLSNFIVHT